MRISNLTECNNFLKSNGLLSLDGSFMQLDQCISNYLRKCSCHNTQDKLNIYSKCNDIYYNIASRVAPIFKSHMLSKTGSRQIFFYDKNRLIGSISY